MSIFIWLFSTTFPRQNPISLLNLPRSSTIRLFCLSSNFSNLDIWFFQSSKSSNSELIPTISHCNSLVSRSVTDFANDLIAWIYLLWLLYFSLHLKYLESPIRSPVESVVGCWGLIYLFHQEFHAIIPEKWEDFSRFLLSFTCILYVKDIVAEG